MKVPRVSEAMSTSLTKMSSKDKLIDAAKQMKKKDIRSILVVDGKKFTGLLTAGDLVTAVSSGKDIKKMKISDVMSKKPFTISSDLNLVDAMKIMTERKIKRLVVVDGSQLKGILTDGDALRAAPQLIDMLVEELDDLKETKGSSDEGDMCESCENYSQSLKKVEGQWLCEECRESAALT